MGNGRVVEAVLFGVLAVVAEVALLELLLLLAVFVEVVEVEFVVEVLAVAVAALALGVTAWLLSSESTDLPASGLVRAGIKNLQIWSLLPTTGLHHIQHRIPKTRPVSYGMSAVVRISNETKERSGRVGEDQGDG